MGWKESEETGVRGLGDQRGNHFTADEEIRGRGRGSVRGERKAGGSMEEQG